MAKLLEVSNLSKSYKLNGFWFNRKSIPALEPLSFDIQAYKTLAIVGETASGKSTLAKLLVGAEKPTTGNIKLNGQMLQHGNFKQRCQHIRMIFQDPNTSLNPRLTVGELLDEPLRFNTNGYSTELRRQIMNKPEETINPDPSSIVELRLSPNNTTPSVIPKSNLV